MFCFVVVDGEDDVFLLLFYPRNLPLKFHQNWVSYSWDIADIEFVWGGWWGLQSHFIVKPNHCVEVRLGVWQYQNMALNMTNLRALEPCHRTCPRDQRNTNNSTEQDFIRKQIILFGMYSFDTKTNTDYSGKIFRKTNTEYKYLSK